MKINIELLKEILNLRKQSLSDREKLLIAATVGIIIIGSIMFLRPNLSKASTMAIDSQTLDTTLTKLETKRQALQRLQSGPQAEEFERFFDHALRYLPSHKPSLEVLLNLSQMAKQDDLVLSSISLFPGEIKTNQEEDAVVVRDTIIEETVPLAETSFFDMSFAITGEREKVLSFIANLGKMAPLTRIEEFSMVSSDIKEGIGSKEMIANLDVRVFHQPLPEALPSISEPLATLTAPEQTLLEDLDDYLYIDEQTQNSLPVPVPAGSLGKPNPFEE